MTLNEILTQIDLHMGDHWIVTFEDGDTYRGCDLDVHCLDPNDQFGNIDVEFDSCLGHSKAKRHALRHPMKAIANVYYRDGAHDKPVGKAYAAEEIVAITDTQTGQTLFRQMD